MTDAQDTQWLDEILAEYSFNVQNLIAGHKPFDDGIVASRWRHNAKAAILAHEAAGRIGELQWVLEKAKGYDVGLPMKIENRIERLQREQEGK